MNALRTKIGQVILAGFEGKTATSPGLKALVHDLGIQNFILFARNLAGKQSIVELMSGIQTLAHADASRPSLIAVDQEGGMVSRLQKEATWFPGAMACAAALEGSGEALTLDDLRNLAQALGAELVQRGFNLNLAPDADVNSNRLNPVIGVRSYGENPQLVAQRSVTVAAGLARSGLQSCAKHFPGHGDTAVDSHYGLPSLAFGLERLEKMELLPFRALVTAGVDSMMTAHVLMPTVVRELGGSPEEALLPATLNPRILQGLLRGKLGFNGPIVTDCLTMKAIADHFPDAPVQALLAGADLLCISHGLDFQTAAIDRIEAAIVDGRLPEARLDEAVARVEAWRRRTGQRLLQAPQATQDPVELARRFSVASLHQRGDRAPLDLRQGRVLYVDTLPAALNGADDRLAARTVSQALQAHPEASAGLVTVTLSLQATPEEQAAVVAAAQGVGRVVVGLYEALRHPGQQQLIQTLRALGKPLSFVVLRTPYDASLAQGQESVLLAWEYTPLSVQTVVEFLMSSREASGGCPVTL